MAQTPDSSPPFARLDVEILDRYLAGLASPAECADVEAWLATDAERGAVLALLQSSPRESAAANTDRWWHKLEPHLADPAPHLAINRDPAGIGFRERRPVLSGTRPRRFWASASTRRFAIGTALAGAIVVAAVALGYGVGASHGRLLPRPVDREYRTAAGQRETVRLPDGTQFTLAPASTLHVPLEYGSHTRAVRLEGEGFFTVVHDAQHPFSVRASNAVATDVGTAFDVRAYAGDDAVRIAIAEGQVDVAIQQGAARRPPLRARDVATISDTTILVTHDVDLASLTAWASGRLEFHDTPLRDVARDLARWYDLEVEVPSGPTGDLPLTGAFTTEPIDNVISVIASTLGVRVQHRGRTVRFLPPTPHSGAR